MKLKTWHLFAIISILFVCSFFIVNQKFDKFYRVNGINNDNRVLIETYLTEDEQEYLIENQIQIDLFIDYIKEPDFLLKNYQYYNALEESNRYEHNKDIILIGNNLVHRLTYLYNGNNALSYAKILIHDGLENAFLQENHFQMEYVDIYRSMKRLYDDGDYQFVEDTEKYISVLNQRGITSKEMLNEVFEKLTTAYSKDSLAHLMKAKVSEDVSLVYDPYVLSTALDEKHYVGTYEPNGLILLQDVPRVKYAMYLQKDAYQALLRMYQDISKEIDGFIIKSAYNSPQSLDKEKIGYDETQLGFTISITKSEVAYKDFETTDVSKWLEEHAYEYGFILRYPKHKASITNKTYDAHIYRYVGKSLAKSLHDESLTLEEYNAMNNE